MTIRASVPATVRARVSVVILTYQRASLIGRALRSVFAQTLGDFEVHVLDDGSTDDTPAVVAGFADPRLHYHPLPHAGNLSRLRNHGVALARADLIAFLDSDDVWAADKLARQVAYLDACPERAFCVTEVDRIKPDGQSRGGIYRSLRGQSRARSFRDGCDCVYELPSVDMLRALLSGQFVIYPTATMIRRAALLDIGGFDERLRAGDSECFYRLAHAYPGGLLLEPLAMIHTHDDNLSSRWRVDGFDELLQALDHFTALGAIDEDFAAPLRQRYSGLRAQVIAAGF